jgi:hypothetical protein
LPCVSSDSSSLGGGQEHNVLIAGLFSSANPDLARKSGLIFVDKTELLDRTNRQGRMTAGEKKGQELLEDESTLQGVF